jgi:hypothetical protein
VSPTITLTPTITDTPLVSDTPTGTPTPYLPLAVEAGFISVVTPNPDAVISPIQFGTSIKNSVLEFPSTLLRNPIIRVFAYFSYDSMTPGAQWTAVWYRNGEYMSHESYPWDGGTGGYYYSECVIPSAAGESTGCKTPPDGWQPGNYSVQIYVGVTFKRSGFFSVEGEAPAASGVTLTPATTTP